MSNRADRRRMMREQTGKNAALLAAYTKSERIERLMAQGISPADVQKAYDDGFDAGYRAAAMPTVEACYAAVGLALHDQFGFGQERCIRAIQAMDERISTMITSEEIRQETMDRLGIEINVDEGVNRVTGKRPAGKG